MSPTGCYVCTMKHRLRYIAQLADTDKKLYLTGFYKIRAHIGRGQALPNWTDKFKEAAEFESVEQALELAAKHNLWAAIALVPVIKHDEL